MNVVESLLKKDFKIPSLPAIAIRVLEAVKDEKMSFQSLAKIISSDPALSARTLSLANSSFYGLRNRVDTMQSAISILGTNVIKNIALSFTLSNTFYNKNDNYFNYSLFWKRSLTTAVGSQLIASILGKKSDDYFITSLLQDIGIVIMYLYKPRDFVELLKLKRLNGSTSIEMEQKFFGFNHQEIGSEVLKKWGLPDKIFKPVCFHHDIEKAPKEYLDNSYILFCSDLFSSFYNGNNKVEKIEKAKEILSIKFGVEGEHFSNLTDSIATQSSEVMSFFKINDVNIKPYSEILQEANEELSKLNLSNAQLIIELNRSKNEIRKLNDELKSANAELSETAVRDGLTGLFNHKYFHDALDSELERVRRYKKPLSLIILDIDNFKKLNDDFGHLAGDYVLRAIGKILNDSKRDTDIISRYGGEEFAIILSETNVQGASIYAERLRKIIKNTDFNYEEKILKISVSLGVTEYTATSKSQTKNEIIAKADKAMYEAKEKGRNRICIVRG